MHGMESEIIVISSDDESDPVSKQDSVSEVETDSSGLPEFDFIEHRKRWSELESCRARTRQPDPPPGPSPRPTRSTNRQYIRDFELACRLSLEDVQMGQTLQKKQRVSSEHVPESTRSNLGTQLLTNTQFTVSKTSLGVETYGLVI